MHNFEFSNDTSAFSAGIISKDTEEFCTDQINATVNLSGAYFTVPLQN